MTFRILEQMATGRRRENWDHTSHVLAKLHNVNCVRSSDLMSPSDYNKMVSRGRRSGAVQTSGEYHRAMYEALVKEGAV